MKSKLLAEVISVFGTAAADSMIPRTILHHVIALDAETVQDHSRNAESIRGAEAIDSPSEGTLGSRKIGPTEAVGLPARAEETIE